MNKNDWKRKKIKEICFLRKEVIQPSDFHSEVYLGLEHIERAFPRLIGRGRSSDVKSLKNIFYPDDVLFGKLRPYLKKSLKVDFKGICSTDVLVLTSKESNDPDFLGYLTHFSKFTDWAMKTTKGINHPRTSWPSLKELVLDVPPLKEQKAIANVLRVIQEAKEVRQKELYLERERKEALMAHLFSHGTRSELRKQTEIGEIPRSWDVVRLGECVKKPEYGYTASATNIKTLWKFLRITDIQNGYVDWDSVPYVQCTPEIFEKKGLEEGDLVIARIGATTGKVFYIEEFPKSIFASYLIRVRTRSNVIPKFLYFFMQTQFYWNYIEKNKGGRLKGGVNIPIISHFKIPYPSIEEQKEIVALLEVLDKKIFFLYKQIQLFEEFFKAMLEELMSRKLSAKPLLERL